MDHRQILLPTFKTKINIEVNQIRQIRSMLETKFGKEP